MIGPSGGARRAPPPNLFLKHRAECGVSGMYLEKVVDNARVLILQGNQRDGRGDPLLKLTPILMKI
jgi:hypothetical protein